MAKISDKVVGGSFIIEDIDFRTMVTPDELTDEQRMIAELTADFVEGEIAPHDEQLEKLDYELTVKLMRKAGELGLLGADVPEAYEGLGLDKVSSTLISENLSKSFLVRAFHRGPCGYWYAADSILRNCGAEEEILAGPFVSQENCSLLLNGALLRIGCARCEDDSRSI